MRRLAKLVAILCAVVLGAAALAFGALQLRPVQQALLDLAAKAISGPTGRAQFDRIRGVLPVRFELGDLRLSDGRGEWLTLRNLAFAFAPAELLRGRLHIVHVNLDEVVVARLPGDPLAPPKQPRPWTPPELPHLPVGVIVSDLTVGAVRLGAEVLGEPLALGVDGGAELVGSRGSARLAAQRIDGESGEVEIRFNLTGEPARLAIDLRAREPTGVLMARLLGRDDRPPLDLRLAGDAPVAQWHGHLTGTAGSLASLDVELGLAAKDGYALSIAGTAAARPLLPVEIGDLLGDRIGIDGHFTFTSTGDWCIERLVLDAAAAKLEASGSYAGATRRIAANLALVAPDMARFSRLLGRPVGGAMRMELVASGPLARPRLRLLLDGADARAAADRAEHVRADLLLTMTGDLGQPETRYQLSGDGRVDGIASASAPVPAGFGTTLRWRLSAAGDAMAETIELRELMLEMQGLELRGNGTLRQQGKIAQGEARLEIADLGALSDLVGRPLAGKGSLDVTARTAAGGAIEADLSGELSELALGDPLLDALIAGRVVLNGKGRRAPEGELRLDALHLESAAVALDGAGALSPEQTLDGRLKLVLGDLARLTPALGMPAAGRLTLDAQVTGALASPELKAAVEGTGLAAGPRRFDRLHATLDLATGAEPGGQIDGSFRSAGLDGTLSGRFALREAYTVVEVPRLRLAANGTVIEGKLRTALDGYRTTGTLTGRSADLAPWGALVGVALAGRAEMKAVLTAKGGQGVDLDLKGNGLQLGSGQEAVAVDRLAVRAQLADLLGKPSGRASVQAGRIRAGGADLATLSLQLASTRPGQFAFDAKTDGVAQRQRFAVAFAGDLRQLPTGEVVKLNRLSGQLAGAPLQLKQPLTFTRKGGSMALADLALGIGGGQVSGAGAIDPQRLALDLKAERLPVALLAQLAGKKHVSGQLALEAHLHGPRARPQGSAALRAQALRLGDGRQNGVPALDLAMDATWRDGKVALDGGVSGPKTPAIKLVGTLPLELEPASLAVRLPQNGAIALHVDGAGQLAELQEVLPIGEDRIAGRFAVDIRVAGTVARPNATGQLTLRDGAYESMATGTVLRALSFDLVGDREHLVLRGLRASDGERGEIAGRGTVDLTAAKGPAIDAAVQLRGFRALRRDEANLAASGELRLAGPLTGLRATAQLRVEQGELRIPDRLPNRVAVLEVTEIDSRKGQGAPRPPRQAEPASAASGAVALDIKVDVPGRVYVRGRGLDGEWRGNLAVTGTSAAPSVVGALQVVRGSVNVLDKQFAIKQGVISFTGGGKIDPGLDIQADADAGDITGTVKIGGTASAPVIKIGSQPELPQDEVLARILFGKSVSQITPAQGLRLAAGAASLMGGGPGYLDRVRTALGLDRFDIGGGRTTSGGDASSLSSTTVTAGKYVAEGVYVGVDQGLSTGSSRAKVEVEITPNISVETRVGASGGNAVGLNWKMDY